MLVGYIVIEVLKIIVCIPIHALWDPSVHGKCASLPKLYVADTSIAVITDTVILLAPIPLAWSMRLPFAKKVKIVLVMGIGGIAVGLTIWRLVLVAVHMYNTDSTWWISLLLVTT